MAPGEGFEPYFQIALAHEAVSLHAQRVLIDGYHAAVEQYREGLGVDRAYVVAQYERCREHAPHREVRTILIVRQSVAHFEHVGVVPVAGAGVTPQTGGHVEDVHHAPCAPRAVFEHLVEHHISPVVRHECATSAAHSHGLLSPHSHIENSIGRPAA